jgi:hypothetical protein
MLNNKKILFIAPSFFGYENDIAQEMIALGAEVDYFDERPFKSSIDKIMNRLDFKFFIRRGIDKYYQGILEQAGSKNYDFLLVISPETLESQFVDNLKAANPKIVSILYMWDSFDNKPNANRLLGCFDKVISFDPRDHAAESKIKFLPLFFNDDFNINTNDTSFEMSYAVSFVGTVHSDRVKLSKKVIEQFENNGFKTFRFYYCPSKLLFFLKKLFTSEYDSISYSEVSFEPISKSEIKNIFLRSNAVIDIQHPDQAGLTMRSIEMLGLQKKLITTNENIVNYDFFDKRNILVIDRVKPIVPEEFISSKYDLSKVILSPNYSLQSWVKSVFSCK